MVKAICQILSAGEFKWDETSNFTEQLFLNYKNFIGNILEVNMKYADKLRLSCNDLPFLLNKMKMNKNLS